MLFSGLGTITTCRVIDILEQTDYSQKRKNTTKYSETSTQI